MLVQMPKRKARDCVLVCELQHSGHRGGRVTNSKAARATQEDPVSSCLSRVKTPKVKGKGGQRKQRAAELVWHGDENTPFLSPPPPPE